MRLVEGVRLSAGGDRLIKAPVHQFRIRQENQSRGVDGIESRGFVQRRLGTRKIASTNTHPSQVDISRSQVFVDADRLLQRLALALAVTEAA